MSVFHPDAQGRVTVQVRIGRTAYGEILRKPTKVKNKAEFYVTVSGVRCTIIEPGGECYIRTSLLPRDLDREGYE